jgi:hypothetical protein
VAVGAYELHAQQMAEAAANAERGRKQNVELFTKMWLTLGPDVMRLDGAADDPELAEAKGLAAHRWNVLLNQEEQIVREEQALAVRPTRRPSDVNDWKLPKEAIERLEKAYNDETEGAREQLKLLKELAKNERRELESWRVDFRRK